MLKLAALLIASAAAVAGTAATATSSTDTLNSSTAWWEKVTVTLDGDGKPEACRYETSLTPAAMEPCDVDSGQAAMASDAGSNSKGEVTRITFERRFTPAAMPVTPSMQPGDLLLGGAVMALAIDGKGAVAGCKVVSTSGSVTPQYGCDEASAERFDASAATDPHLRAPAREGYMTILVYGHSEHVV